MTALKMVTKPLKFKTPEELEYKIKDYFDSCYITKIDDAGKEYQENIRPLTVSGLAYHLDTSRRVLLEYGNKEEFSNAIRKAKARIEFYTEESLWKPKIASGIQFVLKNNYGWIDKQEITQDINANINQIVVAPVVFDED